MKSMLDCVDSTDNFRLDQHLVKAIKYAPKTPCVFYVTNDIKQSNEEDWRKTSSH